MLVLSIRLTMVQATGFEVATMSKPGVGNQMNSIKKQFLYDEAQNPVKVILDYSEWLKIEQALGGEDLEPNGSFLNAYAGKIRFGGDALEIRREMRAEWPA